MAEPISKIQQQVPTKEEQQSAQLATIKEQIANDESGFLELLEFIRLMQEAGALETINSALKAKEDIAKTFLNEWRKEPTTNAINNLMQSSKLLTEADPEKTEAAIKTLQQSAKAAQESAQNDEVLGVFGLMKALKDPDVNRALRYGITFLKGIGKSMK